MSKHVKKQKRGNVPDWGESRRSEPASDNESSMVLRMESCTKQTQRHEEKDVCEQNY